MLVGFGLLLAGLGCGLVLGLTLPPSIPPAQPQAGALAAPERPDPRSAQAAERGDRQAEAEALRQATTAERTRLEAVTQARTAAEAQLAGLQRDIAALAARREALAAISLAAPTPPAPRTPRPEATPVAASPQPRVVLHHRAGSAAAAEAAQAAAGAMREAGFDVNEVRMTQAVPSQRVVRYFHSEDAPAAARLAGRLGRGWAIQDFRAYEPSPNPGTLEVWLPER